MGNDLAVVFNNAVSKQMPILVKATGKTEQEIKSLLISFAYATNQMLIATKQNTGNIDPMSIKEAFKASLDTGIPVDKRQLAYVVKYGNAIQYQLGYKGFIHRIKEMFPNSVVKAELVYKDDIFEVTRTDGQVKYTHKLSNPFASIKDLAGAYAYIEFTDEQGRHSFIETMSYSAIMQIRGKAKTKFVWDEWFGEMAKKAVIRRLCKTLFVGDPIFQQFEDVENNNYEMKPEPVKIEYDKPQEMPPEQTENKADIKEEEKPKEKSKETKEKTKEKQEEVVEVVEEEIPFGE